MTTYHLPTPHAGQELAWAEAWSARSRNNVVRCGRRWGKDVMQAIIGGNAAAQGLRVGLFAPEHKQLAEPFDQLLLILAEGRVRSSRTEGVIRTDRGGVADFWSLNDNELAGRGREYDIVLINEAAFTKAPQMLDIWRKSIKPTLLTRRGSVWVFSTPNGIEPENFFYKCCRDPEYGFREFHAPTRDNPYVPLEELERLQQTEHPMVFQQEYLAEFVDWSGTAFFSLDKWMGDDGQPVAYPSRCDAVFATLDTAVKAGTEHDGTAVIYWATNQIYGQPLTILDWDLVQIEGASLETWLPLVYERLDALGTECGARGGSLGTFIEDKASGTILLQQAHKRGWPAHAIDSKLTAVGKDERAISVSGYHHQGKCRISLHAYDKLVTFKGSAQNHLRSQVMGFRIGDKNAHKRSDDLLDSYVYGLSLGCGNFEGY